MRVVILTILFVFHIFKLASLLYTNMMINMMMLRIRTHHETNYLQNNS
jgi:hypothetical protein